MISILFLGGAKRVSLAEHFIGAAKKFGQSVRIYSYELEEKVPIASVGQVIIGKRWAAADVFDDLKDCIGRHGVSIVLPFVDPAIRICAVLKDSCPGAFIPVSEIDVCETMFDKLRSAEWFEANGIAQPKFFKDVESFEYPVVLKPRKGSASKGLIICKSKDAVPAVDLSGYLCSAYVEDRTEYSVDCYVNREGYAVSVVPRIRTETSGGEVVRSVTVRDQEVIDVSRRILAAGKFKGPITIQFIRNNRDGALLAMEVNPRFGGGVVTSIGAGSGIVDMVLREARGEVASSVSDWEDGVVMARFFKEVIFHADNH